VRNQVGHRPRMVNALKAPLYTPMPDGSVIYGPDSLWNLPLWSAMMLVNALRGGKSLIIAPAIAHAPSGGFPQMSRAQELLARSAVIPEIFRAHFDRTGGLFKVGLYSPPGGAGDTPSKMKALAATLTERTWLRELYGLSTETVQAIDREADELIEAGFNRTYWVQIVDSLPRLHLKTHFYASPQAWRGLLSSAAATSFLQAYYRASAELNSALADGEFPSIQTITDAIVPPGRETVRAQALSVSPEERRRQTLFFLAGSHNQNYRSFVMDGEVAYVVAGWQALHALPDFLTLAGQSVWIDSVAELEELFPRYEGLQRRLGRWMRISV